MLTSQTAKGGSCTQGKDNRGRCNHYLHRAAAASLQEGQGVGNLHLNRTGRLAGWGWGGGHGLPKQPCFTNPTECLSLGRAHGTTSTYCLNAALPPGGRKQNNSEMETIFVAMRLKS